MNDLLIHPEAIKFRMSSMPDPSRMTSMLCHNQLMVRIKQKIALIGLRINDWIINSS
jgi:hypothetical protein